MLSFGMRSQISFAPGKELLVRLPFEMPLSSSIVGAVSLKSHQLSPLAQQLITHIRNLADDSSTPAPTPEQAPMAVSAGQ
jgi:hypothetical protein